MVPSVLLIREYEEQLTGSDCCGVLRGEFSKENGIPVFKDTHEKNQFINEVGSFLNNNYDSHIELKYIDPRNQLYLVPKLFKDVFNYRPPLLKSLKTLFQLFHCPAIIINGIVLIFPNFPQFLKLISISKISNFNRQ